MRKKKEWIPKVGDIVWVRLPMNAKIQRIYKDGSFRLETDDGVLWARYRKEEVRKV